MGEIPAAIDALVNEKGCSGYVFSTIGTGLRRSKFDFQIGEHLLQIVVQDAGKSLAFAVFRFGKLHGQLLNVNGALLGQMGSFNQGIIEPAELIFGLDLIGDVVDQDHQVGRLVHCSTQNGNELVNPYRPAIFTYVPIFYIEKRKFTGLQTMNFSQVGLPVLRMDQGVERHPVQFLVGVTQQIAVSRVALQQAPFPIFDGNAHHCIFENLAEPLFALPQLSFSLSASGDIRIQFFVYAHQIGSTRLYALLLFILDLSKRHFHLYAFADIHGQLNHGDNISFGIPHWRSTDMPGPPIRRCLFHRLGQTGLARQLHRAIITWNRAVGPNLIAVAAYHLPEFQHHRLTCGSIGPQHLHIHVMIDNVFCQGIQNLFCLMVLGKKRFSGSCMFDLIRFQLSLFSQQLPFCVICHRLLPKKGRFELGRLATSIGILSKNRLMGNRFPQGRG
ncbi:MAG: hypothetical protein R6V78_04435 [Desulfosarcina sp.]